MSPPLAEVAARFGLRGDELEFHGPRMAKVSLETLERVAGRPAGKYVVVTSITPTPFGEGKTVHTIGVAMALCALGRRAICTLRQPSTAVALGLKGGGTGGGRARLVPAEELNLHATGDAHAVAAATNLLAAAIDASLFHGNRLGIDPERILWLRCLDVNDRALRRIRIGLGKGGVVRETGFEATAASETMALLAQATSLGDLRERLRRMVVAETPAGDPVTAQDLGAAGAMAALLRDAIRPTAVQTSEGTLALVHAGPFANVGTGNSSVIADRLALRSAEFVVTESGFGADMGAEKCFNLKCRAGGLRPDAALLVATVRALKVHAGRIPVVPGRPLDPALARPDPGSVAAGCGNLEKQIENVRFHGVPVVVAINRFPTDTEEEIGIVRERALAAGACAAEVSDVFALGSEGARGLAEAVVRAAESPSGFRHLYPLDLPLREKVVLLARRVYGAGRVVFGAGVEETLERYEGRGWGRLPVCVAKTQWSLSHDPNLKGRPEGFDFPIVHVRPCVGAGYVTVFAGEILTMPGLGSDPSFRRVDVGPDGAILGLS
ncbi:MAG TPA: formate--tetrahydrofolate ligase [Planctomycetota bacterium]|jgi:formate--tetrahydrofolate ligase|nr:formate--tetrahydrofolate ligase [Planctomycetota bacterium]